MIWLKGFICLRYCWRSNARMRSTFSSCNAKTRRGFSSLWGRFGRWSQCNHHLLVSWVIFYLSKIHLFVTFDIGTANFNHEVSYSNQKDKLTADIVQSMPCSHLSFALHSSFQGYNDNISKALTVPPPSKSTKSSSYQAHQWTLPIYNGCYYISTSTSATAIPIQLFHPAFGCFLNNIVNQDL